MDLTGLKKALSLLSIYKFLVILALVSVLIAFYFELKTDSYE